MEYWIKNLPNAKDYVVYLDGKREGTSCVEAQASIDDLDGWVRRRWARFGFDDHKIERKFYGNVHIVRVK